MLTSQRPPVGGAWAGRNGPTILLGNKAVKTMAHKDDFAKRDEHLPIDELGPDDPRRDPRLDEGISPQNPDTMPRGEDDEETFERSPEFHDQIPD